MFSKLTKTGKLFGLLMLVLFATVSVSSCSKDDDNDAPKGQSSLVGVWTSIDSDGDYWEMVLNKDQTGSISLTVSTRASLTVTERFAWTTSEDSSGNKWLDIIHTSGDDILGTGSYVYIVAGNQLSFGDLVFQKRAN